MTIGFKEKMPTVGLNFLWLELTAHCNEQCVHCYAESGSDPSTPEILNPRQYRSLIKQASDLGCKEIQFIGGEPTLHPHLSDFIKYASECGYEFIEVFTNLYNLPDNLLNTFSLFGVHIATSFYSFDKNRHEAVTQTTNSYQRNVTNIKKVLSAGLELRVGVIEMDQNSGDFRETSEFLTSLGVKDVGSDRLRGFGRGTSQAEQRANDLNELCGNCWSGSLNIRPDGLVSPCIMSRNMTVGNILTSKLQTVVESLELERLREAIYRTTSLEVKRCGASDPGDSCYPCTPSRRCFPSQCLP
jgi:MoaA/NifB/PqqE/SkfB family radical SAM enzyme